jgi:SnoaL-like domain
MRPDEIEKNLTYLLDRQAIYDAIASYSRLVDRLDHDVLYEVYHKDAADDHCMFLGNPEEFFNWVNEMHSAEQISTQHNIGSHLCEIDGNFAHTESYFTYGAMNRRGAPFTLIGGRYLDRLEKRDGKWAIIARKFVVDWAAPSINTREKYLTAEGATHQNDSPPYEAQVYAGAAKSARDRTDPSYDRPLAVSPDRVRQFKSLKEAFERKNTAPTQREKAG